MSLQLSIIPSSSRLSLTKLSGISVSRKINFRICICTTLTSCATTFDLTSQTSKRLTSRTPTTVRWLGCCWEPEKRVPMYSTATRYLWALGFRATAITSLSTPVAAPPFGFPAGVGSDGSEDRWSLADGVASSREGSQGRLLETAAGLPSLMAIVAWMGQEARVLGGVWETGNKK